MAWRPLTGSDQPEGTPLTFLGPLLLGHALESVAPHPLPILPHLPCPLASPWHVPRPIGGPGSHNAVRPTWGLLIRPLGPPPLSPFPILALDRCPNHRTFYFPLHSFYCPLSTSSHSFHPIGKGVMPALPCGRPSLELVCSMAIQLPSWPLVQNSPWFCL